MADPLLTYRGAVYPCHCDHVGHMNVMWYVGKFDEATWQFFNSVGLSPSYLRTSQRVMAATRVTDQRHNRDTSRAGLAAIALSWAREPRRPQVSTDCRCKR